MGEPAEEISGGRLYDFAERQKSRPPAKKKIIDLGPQAPVFRRIIAATQSQSFLPNQAEELAKALTEKFGICALAPTAKERQKMRVRGAKRRLKKIAPGEVAILIAIAKYKPVALSLREAICILRWLEAFK